MSEQTREFRLIRAKRLLNKLKQQEPGMFWFYFSEKKLWSGPKGKPKECQMV